MSVASGAARTALAACAMLCAVPAAAQAPRNPVTETEGPAVEVVGITPVPGLGTALPDIPATVQSSGAEELRRRDARDLAEHLERGFAGVNLNSATGSPYQQDLQYRGFTASPLLGLPQGLSVFVDGVRVNEAFGDMVNWDLIPRNAIANVNLMSGSNPVFGLNTLGGVLTVQTKSGFSFPGTSARLEGGSFGRRAAEFEHGGHGERGDWFVAANATDDAGWREHSSSRIRQAFAKGGWQDSRTDIDVSLAVADNALEGTQAPRTPYPSSRCAPAATSRTTSSCKAPPTCGISISAASPATSTRSLTRYSAPGRAMRRPSTTALRWTSAWREHRCR
jgi:iron complex outermembrane receptor protein